MFSAKFDDIFLSYHRLSACHHVEINAQFFTLCYDRIHILKRKIQFVSIFCCPASCTMQVTCTGRVHQDDPRNVAVMDLSHLTDGFGSIVKSLKSKIHQCGLEYIRVKILYDRCHITVQCVFRITGNSSQIIPVYSCLKIFHMFLCSVNNLFVCFLRVLVYLSKCIINYS